MKKKINVSTLPIMKNFCKTCPFKPNKKGHWQNVELANEVTSRTLFKASKFVTERKEKTESRTIVAKVRLNTTKKFIKEWVLTPINY